MRCKGESNSFRVRGIFHASELANTLSVRLNRSNMQRVSRRSNCIIRTDDELNFYICGFSSGNDVIRSGLDQGQVFFRAAR